MNKKKGGAKQLSTEKQKQPKCKTAGDNTLESHTNKPTAAMRAFGTDNEDTMLALLYQVANVLPDWRDNKNRFNGILAMLEDIAPQNSVESMLAVQMVTAHNMAMKTAGLAMHPDQTFEGVTENMSRANRMMKTFISQTEAQAKLRGNTKTVTIKHVNVSDGGQAIIGDVHHGGVSDGKK